MTVLLLMAAAGIGHSTAHAQDVIVTVSPTRSPLPPQALNYFENPGRFFSVSLQNTSSETLNLFLGIEIKQLEPADGIGLTTPVDIMPEIGVTLPPNMTSPRTLSALDLKNLFKHLSTKDITLTGPTFADYTSGAVGLLPEGHYSGKITAYRLEYGSRNPQVLSNPLTGQCYFDICYTAASPVITEPSQMGTDLSKQDGGNPESDYVSAAYGVFGQNDASLEAYTLSKDRPLVIWTEPVLACSTARMQYRYTFNLYKLIPGQSPEEARESGIIVYSKSGLMGPQCLIPSTAIPTLLAHKSYFVGEVIAKPVVTNQSSDQYSTVENDGRSPLVVMRMGEGSGSSVIIPPIAPDSSEDDKDGEETSSADKAEDKEKEVVYKYHLNPPVITLPRDDGSVWAAQIYKEKKDSIIVNWKQPTITSGPDGWKGSDTLKYTYNIKAVEVKTGMSMDSILVAKGFQETKKRTTLADTIHFKNINKNLSPGAVIAVVVTAQCTNEKQVKFADTHDNVVKVSYLQLTSDEFEPCHPERDTIRNRELAVFNEKELRKMEVQCGQFPLVFTKAILKDKKFYQGEGYVIWKPWGGTQIKIAVEFDSLFINSEKLVYKGNVRNMQEPVMKDIIPYGLFDKMGAGSFVDKNLKQYGPIISTYLQDDSEIGQYYKYIQDGSRLIDRLCGGESGPVYLPLSLPKQIPSCPIDIQILNCEFSPTTAWVNFFGMFKLPESDYTNTQIAAFGLPHQCIGPESFIEDGDSIVVSLLSDISIKGSAASDYEFKLKSPSDVAKMDDGCWIAVGKDSNGKWGFKGCMLDMEMSMPDLLKDDGKGNVAKGEIPCARGTVYFHDWEDWVASFGMDPFQTEDAPGWSFVVGGSGGIAYDHSVIKNPRGFEFPKGYNKENGKIAKALAKGDTYWQGFYLDKMQVRFPKVFEVEGSDGTEDETPAPGTAKPAYGRVALGVEHFMIDDSGLGFTFAGENLLSAHTPKAGGWGVTLDRASLTIVQNKFNNTKINGTFEVPLFKDEKGNKEKFAYTFTMANADHGKDLKYIFEVTPKDKLKMDFWLATVTLPKEKTHFLVESERDTTHVELVMGGKIEITGTKDKAALGFKIPGVEFTGMRLANFAEKTDKDGKKDDKGKGGKGKDDKGKGKDDKDKDGTPKKSQDAKGQVLYTYVNADSTFFFSTGAWSLSSPEKSVGGFDFNVGDYKLNVDGKKLGLSVTGELAFVGGKLTTKAGLTVWAEVDINHFDISYKETTFDGVSIHSDFGGVTVDGSMEVIKKDDENGYSGSLEFKLPGDLFGFSAEGMFVEKTMSAAEASLAGKTKDEEGHYPTYNAAYFIGEVDGTVPLGPVSLTGIKGGFYFNANVNKEPQYGVYGGMFGLNMSDATKSIEGGFDMTVTYDAVRDELSTFLLKGNVKAMKGIINADAMIRYTSTWSDVVEREFLITVTADAKADGAAAFEKFTGAKLEVPEVYSDLKAMQDKSDTKSEESKGKSEAQLEDEAKKEGDEAMAVSCGFSISLEFRIYDKYSITTDKRGREVKGKRLENKWHFYVGEPDREKRCRLTLIDFQLGGKEDPVATWGKLYANGYLCFGNELPGNGALPPIPDDLANFLHGAKDANGNANDITGKLTDRQAAFKQFNPDQQTNKADIKGGVMFGAEIGGEFGLNALICYARSKALAGFDLILKEYDEGAKCSNGTRMGGANGWYGTGQVYAYITGELGLMINLWIFKGKIPLIDVGLGALLQGGFPNPSWFHGQARAKCSLLGGLIKFNSSIEIKAGNVCVPEFGNPLDDIKLLDDITVGSFERSEGWNADNPVSCYTTPAFTTSMVIGKELRLIDEESRYNMANWDEDPSEYDENAKRSYYFFLDPSATLKAYTEAPKEGVTAVPVIDRTVNYTTHNNMSYALLTGARMDENLFYQVSIGGYCKELRWNKTLGRSELVDPVFKDENSHYQEENRAWRQDTTFYFYTDKYATVLTQDVVLMEPAANGIAYRNELNQPKLHMVGDRSSDMANPDYSYSASLLVKDPHAGWVYPDLHVGLTYVYDDRLGAYVSVDEKGNADRSSGVIYDQYGSVIGQIDTEYKALLDDYKKIVSSINEQLNNQALLNSFVPYAWGELCNAAQTLDLQGEGRRPLLDGSGSLPQLEIDNPVYQLQKPADYKIDINRIVQDMALETHSFVYSPEYGLLLEANPVTSFGGSENLKVKNEVYQKAKRFKGISYVDPFAKNFDLTSVSGLCESMQCLLCLIRTCYAPDKITAGRDIRTLPEAYQFVMTPEFRTLNRFKLPLVVQKSTDDALVDLIARGHAVMKKRGEKYADDIAIYQKLCEDNCIDYAIAPITSYTFMYNGVKSQSGDVTVTRPVVKPSTGDSSSGSDSSTPDVSHRGALVSGASDTDSNSSSRVVALTSAWMKTYTNKMNEVLANVISEKTSAAYAANPSATARQKESLTKRIRDTFKLGTPSSIADLYEKGLTLYGKVYNDEEVSLTVKKAFYDVLKAVAEKGGIATSSLRAPLTSKGVRQTVPSTLVKSGTTNSTSTSKSSSTSTSKSSSISTTDKLSTIKKTRLTSQVETTVHDPQLWYALDDNTLRSCGPRAYCDIPVSLVTAPVPDTHPEPMMPSAPSAPAQPAVGISDLSAKTTTAAVKAATAGLNTGAAYKQMQVDLAKNLQPQTPSVGRVDADALNKQIGKAMEIGRDASLIENIAGNVDNLVVKEVTPKGDIKVSLGSSIAGNYLNDLIEAKNPKAPDLPGAGVGTKTPDLPGSSLGEGRHDDLLDPGNLKGDLDHVKGVEGGERLKEEAEFNKLQEELSHGRGEAADYNYGGNELPSYAETGDFFNYVQEFPTYPDCGPMYGYNPPKSNDMTSKFENIPVKENIRGGDMTDDNDFYFWYVDKNLSTLSFDKNKSYQLIITRTDKTKLADMLASIEESYKAIRANTLVSADNSYDDGSFDADAPLDSTNINALMQHYYREVMTQLGGDSAEVIQRKFNEAKARTEYEVTVSPPWIFQVGDDTNFASASEVHVGRYGTVLTRVDYIYPDNVQDYHLTGDGYLPQLQGDGYKQFLYTNTAKGEAFDTRMVSGAVQHAVLRHDPYYALVWLTSHLFSGGVALKGGRYCSDKGYTPAAAPTFTLGWNTMSRASSVGNGIYWASNSSSGRSTNMAARRQQLIPTATRQAFRSHRYATAVQHVQHQEKFYDMQDLASGETRARYADENNEWGIRFDGLFVQDFAQSVRKDLSTFTDKCRGDMKTWTTLISSHATRIGPVRAASLTYNESLVLSHTAGSTYEYELYHIPIIYGRSTRRSGDDARRDDRWRSGYMGSVAYDILLSDVCQLQPACASKLYTKVVRYNGFHCRTGTNTDEGPWGFDVRPGTEKTNVRSFSHQLGTETYQEVK